MLEDFSDEDDIDILLSSSEESEEVEEFNSQHSKVKDFITTIHDYSHADFKSHFRLQRPTAILLISIMNNEKLFILSNLKF